MAFTTTPDLPNDDIQIIMEGLLMLTPSRDPRNPRDCEIHVIQHIRDHVLSVELSVLKNGSGQPFLKLGLQDLSGKLKIATTSPAGVKAYSPSSSGVAGAYPFSFGVNFLELHKGEKIALNPSPIVITLKDGVLVTTEYRRTARFKRASECIGRPVGRKLGARIALSAGMKLGLSWGTIAANYLELPRAQDPLGTKYVIKIKNRRPTPVGINDFKHLYHAITPPVPQFTLEFKACGVTTKDTPRIPCIPGVIDG
jgi:hypothetical protein